MIPLQKTNKIILLVPGESEYQALPFLLTRMNCQVSALVTRGISFQNGKIKVSPKIYRQIEAVLKKLPDKIILLFDRETAPLCPGIYARSVRKNILDNIELNSPSVISVICADHCIENWILADSSVFKKCKLFKKDLSSRVLDRSDCKNAIDIIAEGFGKDKHYDKTRHLPQIAKQFNINDKIIRRRSPSLDKFLREVGL